MLLDSRKHTAFEFIDLRKMFDAIYWHNCHKKQITRELETLLANRYVFIWKTWHSICNLIE